MGRGCSISAFVAAAVIAAAAFHPSLTAQQAGERGVAPAGGRQGGDGRGAEAGGLFAKDPKLPAGAFTASSTLAHTVLRHEWVDIPLGRERLHTWIEYPNGSDRAAAVIVMSHEAGLDDWMRAIADQLAVDGFIAVAPDVLSGRGPQGKGFEGFQFPADVVRANEALRQDEALRRYKAALEYALKLPRAAAKAGSLGIGMGGADSFRFAAEAPNLNAAVVFYGVSPDAATLAKVKAPVAGFYGEDDPRVMSTVTSAEATMKRLGKTYDLHVYPKATQAFLRSTVEGENTAATNGAWPAAIQFLRQHLN